MSDALHDAKNTRTELLLGTLALGTLILLLLHPFLGALLLALQIHQRRRIWRALKRSHLRRRFAQAAVDAGAANTPRTAPKAAKIEHTPAGDLIHLRVGRHATYRDLAKVEEELAENLGARAVTLTRNPDNANHATALIRRQDPLDRPKIPWTQPDPCTIWAPDGITIGTTETGTDLQVPIIGSHFLIGGTTGSGKSVLMRILLATCALSQDPVCLWLFDAKLLELTPWKPVAQRFIGNDPPEALLLLRQLQAELDRRQLAIVERDGDTIRRQHGLPAHVIVVDELAVYARSPQGKAIQEILMDIVQRGRALGFIVIAATQKPHHKVVDPNLRDAFPLQFAFRCSNRYQAETIVGDQSGVAGLAVKIPPRLPGVGYAQADTGDFVRFRTHFIGRPSDKDPNQRDDVKAIVNRAPRPTVVELPEVPLKGQNGSGSRKKRAPATDLDAQLLEHLGPDPLPLAELAKRVGHGPTSGTVSRRLEHLVQEGRAERIPRKGWRSPAGQDTAGADTPPLP